MTTLSTLYQKLCESDDNLPENLLVRIWKHALNTKDTKLAVAVAQHPNLPEALIPSVNAHPAAHVQAAWMSRANMTVDEIVERVRTERRVTVLTAIAQIEQLDPQVISALSEHDMRRVAQALADRPDLPRDAAINVAVTLAKNLGRSTSWRTRAALLDLCNDQPHVIPAVFKTNPKGAIERLHLSVEKLIAARDSEGWIVRAYLDLRSRHGTAHDTYVQKICELLPTVTNPEALQHAADVARDLRETHQQDLVADQIEAALATTSVEGRESRHETARRTGNPALVVSILREDDIDDDTALSLIEAITSGEPRVMAELLREAIARDHKSPGFLVAAFNRSVALVRDVWWMAHQPAMQPLVDTLRSTVQDPNLTDEARRRIADRVAKSVELTIDEIAMYPYRSIIGKTGANVATLGRLLDKELTTDEHWTLFAMFADADSPATVGELIELVHATT